MPFIPSLADLAPDALLTEAEAADYLRVRPGALKAMRLRGRGPAAVRVGRAVRYGVDAVRAFLAGQGAGRPSQAPQFGTPFEPRTTGLACRDGHPLIPHLFASGCTLAQAADALMVETVADWLRATLPDLYAMLWLWGRLERGGWPENPDALASVLVEPQGRLAADLRRLGIVAEWSGTPHGSCLDLIRVEKPTDRQRHPGQGRGR